MACQNDPEDIEQRQVRLSQSGDPQISLGVLGHAAANFTVLLRIEISQTFSKWQRYGIESDKFGRVREIIL
jgi:hypothetical protein